jgi:hypothetical protein
MKFKLLLITGIILSFFIGLPTTVLAASYLPFVLGSLTTKTQDSAIALATSSLEKNGFEVVGSHSPNTDVHIIVVTDDKLTKLASLSENGGFGAMIRVSIIKRGKKTEVSYTNPIYMWNVYRMKGDISPIMETIKKALGNKKEFGAENGLSADELRDYNYKFMMPYFDDVDILASHSSQEEAIEIIENNLNSSKAGVKKVYKIDIPNSQMTVFGVSISRGDGADKEILKQIDIKGYSHAAHLPYEILVNGGDVIALNAKFRIAINWPSLSMMGSGSFMSISSSPKSITKALEAVASE